MKNFLILIVALLLPIIATADDVSADVLAGEWKYVRIVAEDYELDVNTIMEFQPDGIVINYYAPGKELSRGTYEIKGGQIIYSDANGVQPWDVISLTDKKLHVNHRGAEMFFEC